MGDLQFDLPRGRGGVASGGVGGEAESLSQRERGVAVQLGADPTVFPLPARHPPGHPRQHGVESLNRSKAELNSVQRNVG